MGGEYSMHRGRCEMYTAIIPKICREETNCAAVTHQLPKINETGNCISYRQQVISYCWGRTKESVQVSSRL
jgi:hypothetical protein